MNVIQRVKSISTVGTAILLLLAAFLPVGCRGKAEQNGNLKPAVEERDEVKAPTPEKTPSNRQTYEKKGIRPRKARFYRRMED